MGQTPQETGPLQREHSTPSGRARQNALQTQQSNHSGDKRPLSDSDLEVIRFSVCWLDKSCISMGVSTYIDMLFTHSGTGPCS